MELGARKKIAPQEIIDAIGRKLKEITDSTDKMVAEEKWNPPEETKQELLAALQDVI